MAQLALRRLRSKVRIGCKDEERAYPRMIELDVVVRYDMGDAIRHDAMELGVDYNRMALAIERICSEREWKLLETFTADAARVVLSLSERIHSVEVTTRRQVMTAADAVEVTLRMNRDQEID